MSNKRRNAHLCALLAGVSYGAFAVSGAAMAQDTVDVDDQIVVTGSRIAVDSAISAASPVVSIGGGDVATAGELDITALLRESPALQGSLPGSFSAFNGGALGVGQLNLRGLGTERTLVLENGRRHVAGVQGTGSVDVNNISVALLDRVDIFTGGASSIYGADAVTGVVNFILREGDDFDGVEFRAQAGISSSGDAEEFYVSAANGFEYDGGRGQAVFAIEYTQNEPVFASERDFAGSGFATSVSNAAAIAAAQGIDPGFSNTFIENQTLPISSAFGIIALGDGGASAFVEAASSGGTLGCSTIGAAQIPTCQVVDNGVLRPFNPGDIFIGPFEAVGGDAVATNPDIELILPDSERIVFNAGTSYELNQNIEWFAEGKYVFSDTLESNQVNGFNDDIPIALDNPFIPAALQAQIATLQGEGLSPAIVVSRDTLDFNALPSPIAERKTFRIVTGFRGEVPGGLGIDYELSYNYGRTDADITTQNTRIEDRFFAAIDAVVDPATGNIVCRSDIDPSAPIPEPDFPTTSLGFSTFDAGDGQCVPINILGSNTITAEAAAFAFLPTTSVNEVVQEVYSATFTGSTESFFSLPAGPIGYAVGFERREERSEFISDGLVQGGLTFGSNNSGPTLPSGGGFDVNEVFVETKVPLLSDLPFAHNLEFSGAYRYSDYNTIGGTHAWSLGGRWSVTPDLTLRGTVSSAVRAPNVTELFSPQQPAQIGATQDPCNPQFIDAGTEFRAANCAQFVAAGFDSTNFNSAFVPGLSGGNPALSEEEADTLTFGAVWVPTEWGLDGLRVIVDYYNIEIEGLIDTLTAFQIAQNCVDLPSIDNQFCDSIFRDPTDGFITGFVSGEINLGSAEVEGIDFSVAYGFDAPSFLGLKDAGRLNFSALGTHFISNEEIEDPTQPDAVTDIQGEFTRPDWIVNFNADWQIADFTFGYNLRFESSQLLPGITNDDVANDPMFNAFTETGRGITHDFTASYSVNDDIEIYGGINNAFDRDPFLATLSRPAGPRGRFFFIGVNTAF